MRAAEIAEYIFLHVAPLLLADDDAPVAADAADACGHRLVIAEEAVPVEFHKIGDAGGDVI